MQCIALDLGTSNTVVATNKTSYMHDAHGNYVIPSAISLHKTHKAMAYAGQDALDSTDTDLYHILEFKRFVADPSRYTPMHTADDGEYTIADIFAYYIEWLIEAASACWGTKPTHVVATVPVAWTSTQRALYATYLKPLQVVRLIDEPIAASIAACPDDHYYQTVVYDMGAGTLDIAIVNLRDDSKDALDSNNKKSYKVHYSTGLPDFGGTNITMAIYNHLCIKHHHIIMPWLEKNPIRRKRLFAHCERIKKTVEQCRMPVTATIADCDIEFTQSEYRHIIQPLLDLATSCIPALNAHPYVIFIGGPTQSPMLKAAVQEHIKGVVCTSVNPYYAVAIGAAMMIPSAHSQDAPIDVQGVVHHDIGIKVKGNRMAPLIYKGTELPVSVSKVFTTADDYLDDVEIEIYEGNHFLTDSNTRLQGFLLDVPLRERGKVRVRVAVSVSAAYVIEASAEVLGLQDS